MRHAKAVHNSKIDDHERPLHEMGREACRAITSRLEEKNFIPQLILCSTSQRTRETASVLAESIYANVPVVFLPSLYQATHSEILHELRKLDNDVSSILVVGHNPGVYDFCLMVAGSGNYALFQRLQDGFPPGCFVALSFDGAEWREVEPRSAVLEEVILP